MLNEKEVITSRQNPAIKQVCWLLDKKGRRESGLFRFDGIKLFREAVACGLDIKQVYVRENAPVDIRADVESAEREGRINARKITVVSEAVFEKISDEKSPEGIVTVAAFVKNKHMVLSHENASDYRIDGGERVLVAESLRDPGNLGTVIRSCATLGIDRLIISDDCADIYNPKTVRAAMGGLFRLNIDIVPSERLRDVISALRTSGRRVYATALRREARIIGELELASGDCFVIGNEGHGLSESVIDACTDCAIIPMSENSESLNAAAAAAICIWETVRAGRKN